MGVQIVNIDGVAFLEAEDDPPIRPHRYGPEACEYAFQRVEPKTGQVHISGSVGLMANAFRQVLSLHGGAV